jgi:hypothetical protein
MHIVYEPGEEHPEHGIVRAGDLSPPLCNIPVRRGYRMNCNLPLGHLCVTCQTRWRARKGHVAKQAT